MKRVLCIAFICAGLFALAHRPALAVVEYCPASLAYQPVGKDRTAALFGIELNALGPRSVTAGTLAFDTSGGWYTAKIPSMVITKKERHYTSPSATFTRSDWISPIVYVRFPSAITISHAWVDEIQVAGDGAFGWQERGNVQCDPLPALAPDQKFPTVKNDIQMDPKDQDPLSAPASDALVVAAQPAKPLESTDCKEPFRLPTVAEQARPSFPDEMLTLGAQGVTSVEIGINADGSLDDAWVWAPSGYGPFDREALSAARRSTYKNGRAYCRDVPGRYLFKVTFLPH